MKRILFVMSDTGNGHRAAATAIRDALQMRHGSEIDCKIVDVFKHYTPFLFVISRTIIPKLSSMVAHFMVLHLSYRTHLGGLVSSLQLYTPYLIGN